MQHNYRHPHQHPHPRHQRQQRHGGKLLMVYLMGVVTGLGAGLHLATALFWRSGAASFQHRVGLFNKRYTNRLALTLLRAGQPHSPYAVIRHRGRRSGRTYTTPVITARRANAFIIPLAYGEQVDWYRNIRAAGECTIEWQGQTYRLGVPAVIPAAQAISAFPRLWGLELRLYGITHYLQLPILAAITATARVREPMGAVEVHGGGIQGGVATSTPAQSSSVEVTG